MTNKIPTGYKEHKCCFNCEHAHVNYSLSEYFCVYDGASKVGSTSSKAARAEWKKGREVDAWGWCSKHKLERS